MAGSRNVAYYGDVSRVKGDHAVDGNQTVGGHQVVTGNINTHGDVVIDTLGGGIDIKEGVNARMGVATLVAGAKVVANTKVTATSRIQVSIQSLGTVAAPKAIGVTARTAGTSFTITSADNTDTSVIAWEILEPAP